MLIFFKFFLSFFFLFSHWFIHIYFWIITQCPERDVALQKQSMEGNDVSIAIYYIYFLNTNKQNRTIETILVKYTVKSKNN